MSFPLPFVLTLVLVLGLTAGVALGSTFAGWPVEGAFQVAVDQEGNLRLLNPELKGANNTEPKKNEFLLELPSRQLVAMLETMLDEQQGLISDLESRVSELEAILSNSGNNSNNQTNVVTQGLVLWLPLDEGQGAVVTDRSGLGNNGVITGATWAQLPNGQWYLGFDGVNDQVSMGAPAALNITVAITVEAWLKSPFTNTTGFSGNVMLSKGWNNSRGYYLVFNTGGTSIIWGFNDGGLGKERNFVAAANTWYHVVGTYDGTSSKLYINGTQPGATLNYTGDIDATPADNLLLGNDGGRYANVKFGEVRIYSRALDATEIMSNYLATKGRYE